MAKKEATTVKTLEELQKELQTKRHDYIEATRGNAAGELVNPRVLTKTRKEIARLNTHIRALELSTKETN